MNHPIIRKVKKYYSTFYTKLRKITQTSRPIKSQEFEPLVLQQHARI
jgi:hypothetical protein